MNEEKSEFREIVPLTVSQAHWAGVGGAREVAQRVKQLSHKHEDSSSNPRFHTKLDAVASPYTLHCSYSDMGKQEWGSSQAS